LGLFFGAMGLSSRLYSQTAPLEIPPRSVPCQMYPWRHDTISPFQSAAS
jgi:hypothetical protein